MVLMFYQSSGETDRRLLVDCWVRGLMVGWKEDEEQAENERSCLGKIDLGEWVWWYEIFIHDVRSP